MAHRQAEFVVGPEDRVFNRHLAVLARIVRDHGAEVGVATVRASAYSLAESCAVVANWPSKVCVYYRVCLN